MTSSISVPDEKSVSELSTETFSLSASSSVMIGCLASFSSSGLSRISVLLSLLLLFRLNILRMMDIFKSLFMLESRSFSTSRAELRR